MVGGLVVLLVGLTAWYWGGRSGSSGPGGDGAQARAERRIPVAPKISAVVLVNDSREARLGPATPLFVECVLTNPTVGALAVQAAALSPEVRDSGGAVIPVTWERVNEPPASLEAGAVSGVRWVATSGLPAGVYQVGLVGAAPVIGPAAARLFVEAADVVVVAETDAEADAAAAVQLLAWRGQTAEALARIDQALAAAPDGLVLQLWRADLLRDQGREADAQAQYRALASAIDARQRARPGDTAELPFWLAERLAAR